MWQQIIVTVEPSMCLTSLFKPSFTFDIEQSLYICFFMYICSFICKESCSQWLWPPWCTFDDQNLFFALLGLSALLCPSLCVSVSLLLCWGQILVQMSAGLTGIESEGLVIRENAPTPKKVCQWVRRKHGQGWWVEGGYKAPSRKEG